MSEPKEAVNLLSLGHFCARTANKKGSRDKTVSPRNFSREILERRRISRGGRISRTRKFGKSSLDSRESGMKNDEEFRIILEEEWSIRIFRRFFLALREKFSDFFFLFSFLFEVNKFLGGSKQIPRSLERNVAFRFRVYYYPLFPPQFFSKLENVTPNTERSFENISIVYPSI